MTPGEPSTAAVVVQRADGGMAGQVSSHRSDLEQSMFEQRTGRPAVDFELSDASGRSHHLSDFRGRWLLLVFHRHLG